MRGSFQDKIVEQFKEEHKTTEGQFISQKKVEGGCSIPAKTGSIHFSIHDHGDACSTASKKLTLDEPAISTSDLAPASSVSHRTPTIAADVSSISVEMANGVKATLDEHDRELATFFTSWGSPEARQGHSELSIYLS